MSPSTNTRSGPTTSTESTTTSSSTLLYAKQTNFYNKRKYLLTNFDDKSKEYLKGIIADQDEKIDPKPEKQLQTL